MQIQKKYCQFKLREPNKRKKDNLKKTLEEFKNCTNDWLSLIHSMNNPNQKSVHKSGYHKFREKYNLYSSQLQESMNRALQIKKANNGKEYRQDSMSFKGRSIKLDDDAINLPLVHGREWFSFIVPDKLRNKLSLEHGNVIVKRKGKNWFLYISLKVPCEELYEPERFIGIDLGVINIATISTVEGDIQKRYGGNELLDKRMEFEEKEARLQSRKGRRSNAYRALKRLSENESSFSGDLNHKISREIVEIAKGRKMGIAVENLSGIASNLDKITKKARKMLKRWTFRDLINKIEYKTEEEGVPMVKIDPRNTSKTCSNCGSKGILNNYNRIFRCKKCGIEMDRDANATKNIAKIADSLYEQARGFSGNINVNYFYYHPISI